MIHPATELRPVNDRIGYGVFATQPIPAGTITWVRDRFDQAFSTAAVRELPEILRRALVRYSYRDTDGSYVLCWDHARFNNHSCAPTCRTVRDFDIAVRDIPAGGELTIDYAAINVPEELSCHCGAADCRGVIRSVDAELLGDEWDAEIHASALKAAAVAQPLSDLFHTNVELQRLFTDVNTGRRPSLPRTRDLVLRSAGV